jgi:three-Cys-motif partner protein
MPTGEIVLASDNELAILVGSWAREKLLYLKNICEIFNQGMKNRWPVRSYIDLFAGPGRCVVEGTREEIPGSPMLALTSKVSFTHCFFNDEKPELVRALRARADRYGVKAQYYEEDCNALIDRLISDLPDGSLDLCFIDPLNCEIAFDSIRRLTWNRRMDLVITFHINNIKRYAHQPTAELRRFFPSNAGMADYARARAGAVLLKAYEEGLRGIGYSFIQDHVLEKNSRGVPLYYLLFASKHPRGSDFWRKVTARQSSGQERLLL